MTQVADIIRNSPIDFPTAVGYALHRTMRWLLITYIVGAVLLSSGLGLMATPAGLILVTEAIGLVLAVAGAALMFGGGVGIAFKVVVDGVTIANELQDEDAAE